MPASENGLQMVRDALNDARTAEAAAFTEDHPLYGHEKTFVKTAAMVRDLASKIQTGEIELEAAYVEAERAVNDECDELYPAVFAEVHGGNPVREMFAALSL